MLSAKSRVGGKGRIPVFLKKKGGPDVEDPPSDKECEGEERERRGSVIVVE